MMSEKAKSRLSPEDRINAEFKHLRKRIKRLEQIVLQQTVDSGKITEDTKQLNKG